MDLTVRIKGTEFKNPIWVASGTFGCGKEFEDFVRLREVGAVLSKTVTLNERKGNKPPRVAETASGLLNSIGLENKGIKFFLREKYPLMEKLNTKIIVSIAPGGEEEAEEMTGLLFQENGPDAVELNLSCPNVKHVGTKYQLIAQDPEATERTVSAARRRTKGIIIAKLSPNVADIKVIAKAAVRGGADALSVVNTYAGMAVDAEKMRPLLGNITGGLSGPAIKPLALKAVWDVYNSVSVPVIGVGGIMSGEDAAEFMLCGATAVQVGTANLVSPDAQGRILDEFKKYLKRKKIKRAVMIIGKLNRGER